MTTIDTAPDTAPAIIPNFDTESTKGRKLAIICSKGSLDMTYPGLILANAAVGEGVETHMFFTFWGFDIINRKTMGDLQFSFVGNTAMHPPGHSGMGVHHMLGALPGATKAATRMAVAERRMDQFPVAAVELVAAAAGACAPAAPGCRISWSSGRKGTTPDPPPSPPATAGSRMILLTSPSTRSIVSR